MGRRVGLVATLGAIESPAVPLASKELDCEGNQGTGTVKTGTLHRRWVEARAGGRARAWAAARREAEK